MARLGTEAGMMAIVTTGTGGYERLEVRQVPVPVPGAGEVLLQVLAAGVNNTDINTRLGWYAGSVTAGTEETVADPEREGGGWTGATPFPLIQGADCCGRVVSVGPGGKGSLIGARVLVRSCMRKAGFGGMDTVWLGTDFDGAFAQYVRVPEGEVFPISCDWSDAALATIPCAYGTAENMIQRAGVREGERVLIPGASGGVGSALVQLLRRRGAEVVAISTKGKAEAIRALGAGRVLDRADDPLAVLGAESVDVVIDNVGGAGFGGMLKVLRRGGSYVSSGAIAGPVVALDLRDMYLKDIRLIGCTAWDAAVFPDLVSYIERGEIRPLLAATYPLARIADAQAAFQEKRHIGKIALIPPALDAGLA
ncbi:alcohol dehydrogenase family protein [Fuscovulum ytuae]|uniref:Alcohol dehydrogenase family protein n=1 Tax=Fuscovulum ytuae TaxID=3042299 RepID=A0ABY8Q835_9RHOB|nr:alcohol dehydrogenase family protein [Fuscovulum sp. YMD61]WGV16236.1 alcohol dehydrogenase family protein [Fuscovulum sp. YMD61]